MELILVGLFVSIIMGSQFIVDAMLKNIIPSVDNCHCLCYTVFSDEIDGRNQNGCERQQIERLLGQRRY